MFDPSISYARFKTPNKFPLDIFLLKIVRGVISYEKCYLVVIFRRKIIYFSKIRTFWVPGAIKMCKLSPVRDCVSRVRQIVHSRISGEENETSLNDF